MTEPSNLINSKLDTDSSTDEDWSVDIDAELLTILQRIIINSAIGNLKSIQSLEKALYREDPNFLHAKTKPTLMNAFKVASISKKIHVVKYFYDKYYPNTGERKKFTKQIKSLFSKNKDIPLNLFIECCGLNSVEVIKFMLDVNSFDHNTMRQAFLKASLVNNLGVIELLFDINLKTKNSWYSDFDEFEQIIETVVTENDNHFLKQYLAFFTNNINRLIVFTLPIFVVLCRTRRIAVLEWFMITVKTNLNNHSPDAFSSAMTNTQIHDIIVDHCFHGHADVVESVIKCWDLSPINNVSLNINDILKNAIDQKMFDIIRLLSGIGMYTAKIICRDYTKNQDFGFTAVYKSAHYSTCSLPSIDKTDFAPELWRRLDAIKNCKLFIRKTPETNSLLKFNTLNIDTIKAFINHCYSTERSIICGCDEEYYPDDENIFYITEILFSVKKVVLIDDDKLFQYLRSTEDIDTKNLLSEIILTRADNYKNEDTNDYYQKLMSSMLKMHPDNVSDLATLRANISIFISECPMCYENSDLLLECGHSICVLCAYGWYVIKSNRTCMICSKNVYIANSIYIQDGKKETNSESLDSDKLN